MIQITTPAVCEPKYSMHGRVLLLAVHLKSYSDSKSLPTDQTYLPGPMEYAWNSLSGIRKNDESVRL